MVFEITDNWTFVHQLVEDNNRETTKVQHHLHLVAESIGVWWIPPQMEEMFMRY